MKRTAIIGWLGVAALLSAASYLRPGAALAADNKPKKVIVVPIPQIPAVPTPPEVIVDVNLDSLGQDSIYAREIHISPSGIQITERDGRKIMISGTHVRVPRIPRIGHPGSIEIKLPPDLESGEADNNPDQIVQMLGNVHVPADETVRGDVICIFCDVQVDGSTTGSAVSVFGNVAVNGTVGAEATAPFGRVHIAEQGVVHGDVVASQVEREPGGRIGGRRHEILLNFFGSEAGGEFWTKQVFIVLVVLKILFWLFLVLLAHALAARNIGKVKARMQQSYIKAFLMGVLGQILLLPVWLILVVTIIGIPIAVFVMPLLLFAGLILAMAAVGQLVGDKIAENTSLPLHSSLSHTMTGVAALQVFAYLSILFILPTGHPDFGPAFRMATVAMIILAAITGYVVITLGTGAVLLTRFGTRPKEKAPDTQPLADIPPGEAGRLPEATPLPFERPAPGEQPI